MIITENLSVSYDSDQLVLDNISLAIEGPAIIGIIGPNGAGKSTFLKAMLNLVNYTGNAILNDGLPLVGNVAYVEQKIQIDYNFPITVKGCVALGLYTQVGIFKRLSKSHWERVSYVINQVGLSDFEDRPIKTLSGGQFQRMLLARCLIQSADYIFLDEPFVGIDSISEKIIINLLRELRKQGKTILIVHHDLSKVTYYFDKVLILNKEVVAYGDTTEVFIKENLKKAYGDSIFIGEEVCYVITLY